MTLEEILAKAKADEGFDLASAIQAFVAESMQKVNDKNTELLGKLAAAKDATKNLPEDFTLEKWNELIELEKNVDVSKLKGDEALAKQKADLEEAHGKELEAFKGRESRLRSALEVQLIDNAVTAAITEAGGNAPLLLPHMRSSFKVVENDDGSYTTQVVDANGNERFSLQKAGEKMGVAELVSEFKTQDVYKPAFSAENAGGGAGKQGGGRGTVPNPFMKGTPDYNLTEQSKLMNSDPDLAKQLQETAAEAEKQQQAAGGQGAAA